MLECSSIEWEEEKSIPFPSFLKNHDDEGEEVTTVSFDCWRETDQDTFREERERERRKE